jgi:GIY-YIG catalytic domain protein|nr:MAG TPA: intron associated endonuclease [Bacteriophage sp.]
MKGYLYKITNKLNHKFYIGSTVDIVRRFSEHKGNLEKGTHVCTKLQEDFNLTKSLDNFEFIVVKETETELESRYEETELLKKYVGTDRCYNLLLNNLPPKCQKPVFVFKNPTDNFYLYFDTILEASKYLGIRETILGNKISYFQGQVIETLNEGYVYCSHYPNYMTYTERLKQKNVNIIEYDCSGKLEPKKYTLQEIITKYKSDLEVFSLCMFDKLEYLGKYYTFEDEVQPTLAFLNRRSKILSCYDKYGRLLWRVNDRKKYTSTIGSQNSEKLRGILKKNSRVIQSNGTNFNRAYDGLYYVLGDKYDILPLTLVELYLPSENKTYYVKDWVEAGNLVGVTDSAIVWVHKHHNGKAKQYSVRKISNLDIDNLENLD